MNIDVIIPTFNRGHIISSAIESVLSQTYSNYILHIVDDGSTDNTKEILSKYSGHSQIKIYYQDNRGVSSARNLAALKSTGEWISFLDSDDIWLPKKLEIQINYIKEHPDCNFIHSDELWIRNGKRVNPKNKHQKNHNRLLERSLEFCIISPSTVLMRRNLFLLHSGFDEELIVCEDFDLWNKVLFHEKYIGFIPIPLIEKHGGHDDQLSKKFVAMDYWRIKSLFNLYHSNTIDHSNKELIKNVIISKSELLLKNYLKHQNLKSFEEISNLISSILKD